MSKKYYVYRYMLNNEWVYVGKADASNRDNELFIRINCHSKDQRFDNYSDSTIEYCTLCSKEDMDILELMLIKAVRPILNVKSVAKTPFPFTYIDKIQWKDINSIKEDFSVRSINRSFFSQYKQSDVTDAIKQIIAGRNEERDKEIMNMYLIDKLSCNVISRRIATKWHRLSEKQVRKIVNTRKIDIYFNLMKGEKNAYALEETQ